MSEGQAKLDIWQILGTGMAGMMAMYGYRLHQVKRAEKFSTMAAGLTTKERAVARKFWDAGFVEKRAELREGSVARAALHRMAEVHAAVTKLDAAIALLRDPSADKTVAGWLVKHWLQETASVLGQKPTDTSIETMSEVDERLAQLAAELQQEMGGADV